MTLLELREQLVTTDVKWIIENIYGFTDGTGNMGMRLRSLSSKDFEEDYDLFQLNLVIRERGSQITEHGNSTPPWRPEMGR
jgi:hypothetical protein